MKVIINAEAHAAIRARVRDGHEFRPGQQLPSGDWRIELSQGTMERLKAAALGEETISDIILRICKTRGRKLS